MDGPRRDHTTLKRKKGMYMYVDVTCVCTPVHLVTEFTLSVCIQLRCTSSGSHIIIIRIAKLVYKWMLRILYNIIYVLQDYDSLIYKPRNGWNYRLTSLTNYFCLSPSTSKGYVLQDQGHIYETRTGWTLFILTSLINSLRLSRLLAEERHRTIVCMPFMA